MIDINSVLISFTPFSVNGGSRDNILKRLRMLYTTPQGTVPFDREFGIDVSILDEPLNIAQGKLAVEYTKKTRKYEPQAKVKEIMFENDYQNGKVIPKVVVEI